MNILENATNQFRAKLTELRSLDVEEWGEGGTPATIYFRASMNFKDREVVQKLYKDGKEQEFFCMTLILKALDEDGQPLFRRTDKEKMMREIDPELIMRVVDEMVVEAESFNTLKKT